MKIYLATSGEYDDYKVLHAFRNRSDAEAYALGDDVEEHELREGPAEVRKFHVLRWRPDLGDRDAAWPACANPDLKCDQRDFDSSVTCTATWSAPVPTLTLVVQGWDKAEVLGAYREQRARYEAARDPAREDPRRA